MTERSRRLGLAVRRNHGRAVEARVRERLSGLLNRAPSTIEFVALGESDALWNQYESAFSAARATDETRDRLALLVTTEDSVAQAVLDALFAPTDSDALFLFHAESDLTGAAVARPAEIIANAARLAEAEDGCRVCDREARRGLLLSREDDDPGSVTPRWEITAWGLPG
jgi:hypothetical protein